MARIEYREAKEALPVLNTKEFTKVFGGEDGSSLLVDEKGHIRSLEFIALPKTLFEMKEKVEDFIWEVKTKAYPSKDPLYVDERFLQTPSLENPIFSKSNEKIVNDLISFEGLPYLWGGNYAKGIFKLLEYYPPLKPLDEESKKKWTLQGVDCTGLLYEVTNGHTPRNSSSLIHFGKSLDIENLSIKDLSKIVKPLDLIVYIGHIIIILDKNRVIESRESRGVVISSFEERMQELLLSRKKANIFDEKKSREIFLIKRWI